MMRHTEGVWTLWSWSVGLENCVKDTVCVWVCVCVCVCVCGVKMQSVVIHWVIIRLHCPSCQLSSVSSYLLVSSQVCLGFLERVRLQLMSIFFCPHVLFSHLFILPLSRFSPVFFFYHLLFPLFFVVLAHPSLSCSVVVEVCSSLLFLSIWADVWHLSNPWNTNR